MIVYLCQRWLDGGRIISDYGTIVLNFSLKQSCLMLNSVTAQHQDMTVWIFMQGIDLCFLVTPTSNVVVVVVVVA